MTNRTPRRRIVVAAAALAAAATAVALALVGLQPVDTAATPTTQDARVGGVADAASTPIVPARVATVRTPVAVPAPSADPADQPASTGSVSPELEVLALVNAERTAAGCSAVSWDEALANVARVHSADMAARDFFDHTNPDGLGPFDRAAAAGVTANAENIAAGQQTAADVMASWMSSPGHRANILNCGLTRLGVGVGYGGSYGITWTQLFGS